MNLSFRVFLDYDTNGVKVKAMSNPEPMHIEYIYTNKYLIISVLISTKNKILLFCFMRKLIFLLKKL